ncbi:MAG: carbohydrate binding family 9 domain-containing protein, partial [Ignavibacteriales bacterium]|nr:carbohydrate binding family 9 domain-containing protein [Ignavibacteriales bacterium]
MPKSRLKKVVVTLSILPSLLHSALFFVPDTSKSRPTLRALRVSNPISVDGLLTEEEWQAPGISDFTQRDPEEGRPATQKTEVWVAYDDAALYVAARLHDTAPDSIVTRLGRRDADLNSDFFFVGVDSYHDRRNAFYFGVNPGGSIQDGTFYNDQQNDNSWDGVWEAATSMDSQGWTAEMRIPFSQLRFPDQSEYIWGINFLRIINRRNEEDYFVMVPKKESGDVSHWADLIGIRDIHPPARLEILPYAVSSNLFTDNFKPGDPFNDGKKFSGNIGADVKVGLGSNLTLNATFNPDFGQVEVDPAVVNLTQYETFFDEKRPFFIEGSSFFRFGRGGVNSNWGFNWGDPDFFYSRRIGRPPQGSLQHSGFSDFPDRTAILAAAKLTGKISQGWSLGSLHAVTASEKAVVDDGAGTRNEDEVEPFASHNVIRSLREFNDGAQGVGVLGTAVVRDLSQPYLAGQFNRNSFALGADGWTNLDSDRMWVVSGWGATTRIEGSAARMLAIQRSSLHYFQQPDSYRQIDSSVTSLTGTASRVALNKQKGNWKFNSAIGVISPGFNSNDLGFLFQTNVINGHVVTGYQWYDPDGTFRRKGFNVAVFRSYDFSGNKIGDGYFFFGDAQFMNYWSIYANGSYQPSQLDNTVTRGGPLMASPYEGYNGGFEVYTDSRQDFVFNVNLFGVSKIGRERFIVGAGVEWKPRPEVKVSLSPGYDHNITSAQWGTQRADPLTVQTNGVRYVFANIDQKEFSANIR